MSMPATPTPGRGAHTPRSVFWLREDIRLVILRALAHYRRALPEQGPERILVTDAGRQLAKQLRPQVTPEGPGLPPVVNPTLTEILLQVDEAMASGRVTRGPITHTPMPPRPATDTHAHAQPAGEEKPVRGGAPSGGGPRT